MKTKIKFESQEINSFTNKKELICLYDFDKTKLV